MSEENVEVVRTIVTAIAGQDLVPLFRDTDPVQLRALMAAAYDPDVEVIWVDTSPDSGPYHGHGGVIQAMMDWLESFEEFHFEPTEFIDAGDVVVVPNRSYGIGKGSGAEVEMTTAWVYTVKKGRIARVLEYSSKEKALEAAGLRK